MYSFLRLTNSRPLLAALASVWGQALAVSNGKYQMCRGRIAHNYSVMDCSNFRQGDRGHLTISISCSLLVVTTGMRMGVIDTLI